MADSNVDGGQPSIADSDSTTRVPTVSSLQPWMSNPAALLNPRGNNSNTGAPASGSTQLQLGPNHQPSPQVFHFSNTNDNSFATKSNDGYQDRMQYSFSSNASPAPSLANNLPRSTTSTPKPQRMANDLPKLPLHGMPAPVSNGMGSMIERMNGVQDRSTVPVAKRRKVTDVDAEDQPKYGAHSSSSSSSSGMLSGYLKEKQHTDQSMPPPSATTGKTPVLDLTTDDDDEVDVVAVVKDPREEEVCYGMIAQASINCHLVPTPKPGFTTATPGSWPQIKVRLQRLDGDSSRTINVLDHTRTAFGKLNAKVANGLIPLLDARTLGIRTDALIGPRPRQSDEVAGKSISRSYNLQLMLYGKQRYAKTVGKHLSKPEVGLNLLSPFRVEKGIRLFNPLAKENRPSLGPKIYEAPPPPVVARTPEQIRADVFSVFDSLTDSDALPECEPDARILTPLLKHQKQALWFMKDREDPTKAVDELWKRVVDARGQIAYYNVITNQRAHSPPPKAQGGILADMMGLGKTLSILSLITSTTREAIEWADRAPERTDDSAPRRLGASLGPTSLPYLADTLGLTKVRKNAKTTLLVCPLSTTTNWEEQIKQHIQPLGLTYYLYHGQNRIKDWNKLVEFDLVITTYNIASNELGARARKSGKQPLEEIGWFRIVLDEAHAIREPSTLTFKAICRLHASRRWAVTGTPVQNKLDDLGSLLAFLRIKPFHDRNVFKAHIIMPFKVCDEQIIPKIRLLVDSITIRRMKDKIDIPKRHDEVIKLRFSDEERWLYEAFQKDALLRVSVLRGQNDRLIGQNKYVHILKSILRLRMFCSGGKDLMKESDLRMLEGMSSDIPIDIDSDDDEEATNPALTEAKAYDIYNLMQDTGVDICEICQQKLGAEENEAEGQEGIFGHITSCYHLVCMSCMAKFNRVCPCGPNKVSTMPLHSARAVEEHDANVRAKANGDKPKDQDGKSAYTGPNTKLRYLLNELQQWKDKSVANPDEAPYKSVVFSEWTTNLDLIQRAMQDADFNFVRLDGSMNLSARARALDRFRDDPSIQVILVSTKAGSLGLNLTAGNSVYIIEPLYNPAAEAQAIDRVHRLGQKREVHCVRLLMDDSIEMKMRDLQDKKIKLAALSMDRHAAGSFMSRNKYEAGKARLEEILSLFGKGSKL
ncbi:unnamed protein product [Discula destructiva]